MKANKSLMTPLFALTLALGIPCFSMGVYGAVPPEPQDNGAFTITGVSSIGNCDAVEAEANAMTQASQACEPSLVRQVSEWKTWSAGYCRQMYAIAKFSCAASLPTASLITNHAFAAGADLNCQSIEYVGVRVDLQIRDGEAHWQKLENGRVVFEGRAMLGHSSSPSFIVGTDFTLQLNDTQDGPSTNAKLIKPQFDQGFLNFMYCK